MAQIVYSLPFCHVIGILESLESPRLADKTMCRQDGPHEYFGLLLKEGGLRWHRDADCRVFGVCHHFFERGVRNDRLRGGAEGHFSYISGVAGGRISADTLPSAR